MSASFEAPQPAAVLTAEDYARAQSFLPGHVAARVFLAEVEPNWLAGGERFWYRRTSRLGITFVTVETATGARRPAFEHARLAAALQAAAVPGAAPDIAPERLPIDDVKIDEGDGAVSFAWLGLTWRWDPSSDRLAAQGATDPAEAVSPDGRWGVKVVDHDLWLRDARDGSLRRLTHDGAAHHAYGAASGACLGAVRDAVLGRTPGAGSRPFVAWAPDSSRFATWQVDESQVRELAVQQSVPPAGSSRPVWHRYRMPLVGDPDVPLGHLVIGEVASGVVRRSAAPPLTRLTYDPFATRLAWWSADGARLYSLHVRRGGRRVSLHRTDAATGGSQEVLAEQGETFVFPHHVPLANTNVHELVDGHPASPGIVWFSQRTGWGHLELHRPGAEPVPLTAGAWTVRDVVHVDAQQGWIYFTASGREPGRDPYFRHLYRVRSDGTELLRLTPEDAEHEIRFSPDGHHFLDTFSRVDLPPRTVLRRCDGERVAELEESDIDALTRAGWSPPLRVTVKARDGVTDLFGCLTLPSRFDPARRYPLVDNVYPGPQMIRTPKAFAGGEGARRFWQDQAVAELGFVVLTLDGFGTPFRSKAFVDRAAGRHFGEAGGLADHVAAIHALARRHPWIDGERVGIMGHSGGGFAAARAMLQFPDVFKVGIATAGNHDQRGYDAGWGEFWVGLQEDDNYAVHDNTRLAGRLRGKLLLMHGEMDDNVHPSQTMRLVDALIASNRDFDLLIVPFTDHAFFDLRRGRAAAERLPLPLHPYVLRKQWDYLVTHLLGALPPREVRLEPEPAPDAEPVRRDRALTRRGRG